MLWQLLATGRTRFISYCNSKWTRFAAAARAFDPWLLAYHTPCSPYPFAYHTLLMAMASNSINVPDTWVALLEGGTFPGGFSDDGTVFTFPVVESLTTRGSKIYWRVEVQLRMAQPGHTTTSPGQPTFSLIPFNRKEYLGQPATQLLPGVEGVIISNSWHEGGELRKGVVPTIVTAGKNIGKKNATNVITQAMRNALGLYNKHLKGGGHAFAAAGTAAAGAAPDSEAVPGAAAAGAAAAGAAAAGAAAAGASRRPFPMLVKKIGATADANLTLETFRTGVTLQRKLNGVRMVAYSLQDAASSDPARGVCFYSRTGGEYQGMDNLRRQVGQMLGVADAAWTMYCANLKVNPWTDHFAPGQKTADGRRAPTVYLDGELYKHGKELNWISGESRSSTGGDELEYWVFDCFFPELEDAAVRLPSRFRQQYLDMLFLLWRESSAAPPRIVRVANIHVPGASCPKTFGRSPDCDRDTSELANNFVFDAAKRFVTEGFEGAIARKDDKPYQYGNKGYHSSNLVKIKPLHDAEYPVTGFTQGTRGKDVGALIWQCIAGPTPGKSGMLPGGHFNVVPKNMTYETRYKIFKCLSQVVASEPPNTRFERDFLGKPLTVEFPELSAKTGIPTQAKALAFRTYEPGRGYDALDPIARLLRECP